MKRTNFTHDSLTIGAIAAIAFITACVSHEAIGHGGTCLAVGGRIVLLTSVHFGCQNGGALTDAAGLLMNLALGGTLWIFLRTNQVTSVHGQFFLVLSMAYNLFWVAGQTVSKATTNSGDAAFVLGEWALTPLFLWRGGLVVAGLALYFLALRAVAVRLPRGLPLLVPYLVVGTVACLATLCYTRGVTLPTFREGVEEGFGTGIGLLLAGRLAMRERIARAVHGDPVEKESVTQSIGWVAASAVVTLVFLLTMGREWWGAADVVHPFAPVARGFSTSPPR